MMGAMRFRHELSYDAPPEAVYAMLADPDFRRMSAEAMQVISADVQLDRGDDGFTLVIDQQQNTKDLPAFARTFAGESTHVIQREEWRSTSGGTLVIESPGKPVATSGTIRLEPSATGTTEVVELDITVKVPLLGGRLEKLMAQKVAEGMDVERSVGVSWLEEH
jgi:uncharacterized protein YndB with AHSA1/START domain